MLFTFLTILWIVIAVMAITRAISEKQQEKRAIPNQNHAEHYQAGYLTRYTVNEPDTELANVWVINYIKNNGGMVNYEQMKTEFTKKASLQFNSHIMDMIDTGVISHEMNTDTLEETVKLN